MNKIYVWFGAFILLVGGSQVMASAAADDPAPALPARAAPQLLALPELDFDEMLGLVGLNLNAADIIAISKNWPANMKGIVLDGNNLGDEGMRDIASVIPEGVTHIELTNNNIGSDGVIALAQRLQNQPFIHLYCLNLSNNAIGSPGMITLSPHLPARLNSLWLNKNNIGDAGVIALLQHLPTYLQSVWLANNEFAEDGRQALINAGFAESNEIRGHWERHVPTPPLLPLPPLTRGTLIITNRNLDVADINLLSQNWPADMSFLMLRKNNLDAAGMKALTPHLSVGLRSLGLSDNNIGDDGAIALAQRFQSEPSIKLDGRLDLEDNHIGDNGIIALAQHIPPNLQTIWLSGNDFGVAGQQALIDAHFAEDDKIPGLWERQVAAAPAAAQH